MIARLLSSRGSKGFVGFVGFIGFWSRDIRVLRRGLGELVARTIVQPLLFVFFFTFVLPKIGGHVSTSHNGNFGTVILAGIVGFSAMYGALFAVGIPLSIDFGVSREIDDRIGAPCSWSTIGIEKIAIGAINGLLAALVVIPLFILIPVEPIVVSIDWLLLLVSAVLTCIMSAAIGLLIGSTVSYQRLSFFYSVVPLVMFFLGCNYYSWPELRAIPWLKIVELVNPLVYVSESLRSALTPQISHMDTGEAMGGLFVYTLLLAAVSLQQFSRRCER